MENSSTIVDRNASEVVYSNGCFVNNGDRRHESTQPGDHKDYGNTSAISDSGFDTHALQIALLNSRENLTNYHNSSQPTQTSSADATERNSFESTLTQFLNSTHHDDIGCEDEPNYPINSVYDLLSAETRDYLRKHYNYSGERLSNKPEREVKIDAQNKVAKKPVVRTNKSEDIPPTNDALSNYMRTMQRYIGRSSFHHKKTDSVCSTQKSAISFGSTKPTSLGGNYGYESLHGIGEKLDDSVRRWLIGLRLPNLATYIRIFEKNEIDGDSLKLLSENQLRRMGINSYGPLNKMLHSIRVMRNFDPPRLPIAQEFKKEAKAEKAPREATTQAKWVRSKKAKTRSSSAPSAARLSTPRSGRRRDANSSLPLNELPHHDQPDKEKCLLRLLVKENEIHSGTDNVRKHPGNDSPSSARPQVSEVQLVRKAEIEIGKAAKKFQSKIDKDARKKDAEERLDRMLREKRMKFAADYQRRQETNRHCDSARTQREEETDNKRGRRSKRMPRSARELRSPEKDSDSKQSKAMRNKENVSEYPSSVVETQMAIDAAKPNLIFEDQLNDLEFQIQNLVDIQTLKQSDSRSLLACIDQLQNQLHNIQSMVSHQRAAGLKGGDEQQFSLQTEHVHDSRPRKRQMSPRTDAFQSELRFNERDFVGEGMFSQVFRGKFKNRDVAVKRLRIPLSSEDKSRLSQEVNLLMELKHQSICSILGCNIRMKFPLLITKFCTGGSLRQLLLKAEPLDHSAFYQIAEDVCSGLSYLHSGSTLSPRSHLRLTSHNILLDSRLRACLSDIGLSRLRHECSRAIRQAGAGRTEWSQLPWMAPEVLAGEEAGPPADMYSFGIVLWEMLMRQVPYNGLTTYQMMERIRDGPPLTVPDSCPISLRGLIRRCWQLRPADRTTVQEALLALSRQKFPVSWQTVLQSAGISSTMLSDVLLCRRIISKLLNLSIPRQPGRGSILPPNGPCGLLSFPIPDLELTPVSQIEELAQKVTILLSEESDDLESARNQSPLSAELSARGAIWLEKRGSRLHDQ